MKIIVCVANDENEIEAWVAYHLALGFDRVIVYANEWACPDILNKLNSAVTVISWPGKAQQMNCYNHALRTQAFDWAAFIDCDEYLCCPEGLDKFLSNRKQSVAVPWVIYGNRESPGENVLQRFRHWDYDSSGHVKVIVKNTPALRVLAFDNPHYLRGDKCQTPNGCNHNSPFTKELPHLIYIKHFYYQDFKYWEKKIARGRADNGATRNELWSDGYKFNKYYHEPHLSITQ